jgi:hypothetical protein
LSSSLPLEDNSFKLFKSKNDLPNLMDTLQSCSWTQLGFAFSLSSDYLAFLSKLI